MKAYYLKYIFLFLTFVFLGNQGWAQQLDGQTLKGMIQGNCTESNSVLIRWAPLNYYTFQTGNDQGYSIEKMQTHENNVAFSLPEQFRTRSFLCEENKPNDSNSWGSQDVDADVNSTQVAKAAIYSEEFEVDDVQNSEYVQAYNLNMERQNRYNFGLMMADQDFEIAKAMGLAYVDQQFIEEGQRFLYILYIHSGSEKIMLDQITIGADTKLNNLIISDIQIQSDEKKIHLQWPLNTAQSNYVSYRIERSSPDNQSFQTITDRPLVFTEGIETDFSNGVFVDQVENLNTKYYYRIIGKNAFGLEGPVSEEVMIIPVRKRVTAPTITQVKELSNNKFKISYSFPAAENSLIKYVKIYRADSRKGPWTLLKKRTNISTRRYYPTFHHPVNYIKIVLEDKIHGDVESLAKLIQIKDTSPPKPPSLAQCSCDQNGKVSLVWNHNIDPDLKGYRVWFSNQMDGNYSEVTHAPTLDSIFTDYIEVETLSEEIYYKISALDLHENESELSIPCTVLRPDIVPPTEPVLMRADPLSGAIELEWKWSLSQDVAKHELQRKGGDDWNWNVLETYKNHNSKNMIWSDTALSYLDQYSYRILAYDERDNISSSKILHARAFDDGLRGPISRFSAIAYNGSDYADDERDQNIKLIWNYAAENEVENFLLYRKIDNGPMVTYKTLNKENGLIIDQNNTSYEWEDENTGLLFEASEESILVNGEERLQGKRTITYQIMARHIDGGFSSMSDPTSVQLIFTKAKNTQ